MRKNFLSIFLTMLVSTGTLFAKTIVDGIWYEFDKNTKTASVTSKDPTYPGDVYTGSVVIPPTVTYNGVEYNVTSIGGAAFEGCSGLTTVTIPNSVTSIGYRAFYGCSSLTSVTIPNSVTSIGDWAFRDCSGLTSVTIPNSITNIGSCAFYGCSGLTSVTIPNSVTSIGDRAFYDCSGLTSIDVASDNPNYCSIDDVLFNKDKTELIQYPISNARTEYTIPNSVTSIGYRAFYGCSSLTSVTIPNSVTSIGNDAFSYCTSLTSVTIPNSVTSIGSRAFLSCRSLTSVTIPNSVTSMGNYAFSGCSGLTSVTIPNSVTSIGNDAFSYCTSLTSVTIPNSVTSIGSRAFYGCSGLTSVTIPNSVTSIGRAAFDDCSGLTSIYVPCGELERFRQMLGNDNRVKNEPLPYNLTISAENGSVTYPITICDDMELSTSPNYGYHFTQWSDGDINNPRTIQLVQDTSFTAEFAKNVYAITANSNNIEYGFATGGKTAEYMDKIELTATPQIGHHFNYWQSGSTKYITNPLQVTVSSDATYTAYFSPNIYSLTVNANSSQGYVTAQAEFLQEITMTATPLNGFEFVKWNDGNQDNPRTVQLTQDTAFTAEFAKAQYAITTAVNDESRGTTTGDNIVDYLSSVTLTATAEYGYHFDHWENNGKTYSANPLTVTATGNASYTAYFIPNIYSVVAYSDNTSWGTVSAPSSADYLDYVTLTAKPVDGAMFVQWSDGNKDNPRTIQVTEDVTLSAEFAVLTSGCVYGDVFWSFKNNTLFIEGMGYVNPNQCQDSWVLLIPQIEKIVIDEQISSISTSAISNLYNLSSVVWNVITYTAPSSASEAPFYGVRNQIYSFEFGKQVKKIPAYLCYGMTGLTSLTIGSNVTNIGKNAFDGCEDIKSISCEATTPPNCGSDAFAGISIFIPVYVPVNSVDMYAAAPVWRDFYTFSSIQAEEKIVTNVTATPSDNSVVMAWPAAEEADVYTLVIERNGVTFCVLSFNAQGQLLGIQFAPGLDGSHNATYATQTATGWQFTVTSLQAGTKYDYTVTAKKEGSETPVYVQSGSFTTTGTETAINQVTNDKVQSTKFLRNGQFFILRGDKTYTITGQEVK